jgi:hypothetical protein
VNNPKVAAAVAEICMVGLATTAQATKGPPKPDKARIDRLAYVVSESLPQHPPKHCSPLQHAAVFFTPAVRLWRRARPTCHIICLWGFMKDWAEALQGFVSYRGS